jgi:hypothetical protein
MGHLLASPGRLISAGGGRRIVTACLLLVGVAVAASGCYVVPAGYAAGPAYAAPAPVYAVPAPVYVGPYWGWGWRGRRW